MLALLGFVCVIVGARWWLIGHYGNPVPYWDQWDGEAATLYAPFASGTLTWAGLIEPHNEHRILTTRLYALGLYVANGQWNPLLQMAANALVLAAVLVAITGWLGRALQAGSRVALCIFCAAFFSVPFSWENTLAGFQTQFYFNLLFSFTALWLLLTRRAVSLGWWAGAAAAVLAYFSLASGVFALAAAIPVLVLQGLAGRAARGGSDGGVGSTGAGDLFRPPADRFLAALLLAVLFAAGYAFTPEIAQNAAIKAHSAADLVHALKSVLSWPHRGRWLPVVLLNLPALLFVVMLWRRRKAGIDAGSWFLLGVLIWVAGQALALAFGRAAIVRSPRYLDLFAMGTVANFTCLLWCLQRAPRLTRLARRVVVALWLAYLAVGMARQAGEIHQELDAKRRTSEVQLANVQGYLVSGDPAYLYGKAMLDIPYPRADRLQQLLDDRQVRRILPAAVVAPASPGREPGRFDSVLDWLLAHAYLVILLGALFTAAAMGAAGKVRRSAGINRNNPWESP